MARELRCADLIPGCSFVARGTHESEVMKRFAEHAKRAHQMVAIGMEVEKKARATIRDAPAPFRTGLVDQILEAAPVV
jgi:predicted small metal-binding protein